MLEPITKIIELFVQGNKKVVIKLLFALLVILVLLPVVLNYFYKNIKTEQEIRILKELMEINYETISDDRLKEYYNNIINSLDKKNDVSFGITFTDDAPKILSDYFTTGNIYKFISGSFWWVLLFIISFFIKQKTMGTKIAVQIVFLVLILIFGIIGVKIPSFSVFVINIIGFPLIQIMLGIFIGILINKLKKNKKI